MRSVSSMFRIPISNNHENTQFVEENNTTVLHCLVECNLHQSEKLMYTEVLRWSQKWGQSNILKSSFTFQDLRCSWWQTLRICLLGCDAILFGSILKVPATPTFRAEEDGSTCNYAHPRRLWMLCQQANFCQINYSHSRAGHQIILWCLHD